MRLLKKRKWIVILVVILVTSSLFYTYWETESKNLRLYGIETQGLITDKYYCKGRGGNRGGGPCVDFTFKTDQGMPATAKFRELKRDYWESVRVGQSIPIKYMSSNPDKSESTHYLEHRSFFDKVLLFGGIFALQLAVIYFVWAFRYSSRRSPRLGSKNK